MAALNMPILAFDSSTAGCAVALLRADGTVVERRPSSDRLFTQPSQTRELLPLIDEVLRDAQVDYVDLGSIAVGVGPGAFTGLRIGVATARAIASAMALPITPVSSLAALAHGSQFDAVVLSVIDARRKEMFCGVYGPDNAELVADCVVPRGELAAFASRAITEYKAVTAVGDGAIAMQAELRDAGVEVPANDQSCHIVSGAAIGNLSLRIDSVAVNDVLPHYIRESDAQVSSRERWQAVPNDAIAKKSP
ncbi:MAG: tRNA (adenosine(37)-N6)-threonylcarbamoyltransferase complex dimerization subunit type 1 TsaB [Thermoleophilaceae bacterium]|nr:tRNA (adenosine(37)-N6)-threonylcarbamoyltransferase complex dimerization subunit type 1 TsaB [Thermoleophilaceae bacterium]